MSKQEFYNQLKAVCGDYIFYRAFDSINLNMIININKALLKELPRRENLQKAIQILDIYDYYLSCIE